jgi:hypothetical protein
VVGSLSDAEQALLAVLPDRAGWAGCESDPDRPEQAVAALRCTPGPGGVPGSARFQRFTDVASLDRVLEQDAADRGLPQNGGDCGTGVAEYAAWTRNGGSGVPAGRLVCYSEPDEAWTLRWTDYDALASGTVTRTDGDAVELWAWLRTHRFR